MKNKFLYVIVFLLVMLTLILSTPTICYAETKRQNQIYVYDNAEILTKDEENALQRVAQKYEEYEISVVFLTSNNTENMNTSTYIKKFYNNQNFYPDGVIFFINTDPDNYEAYIDTIGKCIDTLSIDEMDTILNEHSYLAISGKNFDFFSAIEQDASDLIIESSDQTSVLVPTKGSIATTVIVVVFLVIFLITKHNAANKRPKAQIYLNQTFEILSKREVFKGDRREIIKDYYKTDNRKTGTNIGIPKFKGRGGRF